MSEQSPRDAAAEIRALIDADRADEAIDRARRLLFQAPRYLLGYRLLAEAALARGHRRDAVTLFRRVLSADPECFISYAGIAAARDEEGDLEEALWHMERSFELRPDRPEIRAQLRALRRARDGRAPGRLRQGEAGRARASLAQRPRDAIRALERLLAADPERTDLRVALAEATWRAGRRHTAAFHAERALSELPHCLKATLILAQFHLHRGERDAAEPFLENALALDPDHAAAQALFGDEGPLGARTLTIRDEPPDDAPLPEWLADLDLFTDGPRGGPGGGGDWRNALRLATGEALGMGGGEWRVALRRATAEALDGPAPLLALPPAWRAALRSATGAQLGALAAGGTRVWDVEEEAAPPNAKNPFFTWEFKRPEPPPIVSEPPPELSWEEALAYEEAALLEPPSPTIEEEEEPFEPLDRAASFDPDAIDSWEEALAAEMALLERDDADELARLVEEGRDGGEAEVGPTWRDLLRINTDLALALRDEEAPPAPATPAPWTAALRGVTEAALDERPEEGESDEGEERGSGLVGKLKGVAGGAATLVVGGAGALRDVAGSAAERLGEGAGALRERLGELRSGEGEEDATEATDLDARLAAARAAWEGGDAREAMRGYHDLFAEEADNGRLAGEMEAWVVAGSAPALVYHLLGDLCRRMGRDEEAARYYREAVERL